MKQIIAALLDYLQANGEVEIHLVENTKPVLSQADYPYAVLGFPGLGDSYESLSALDEDGDFDLRLTFADTTPLNLLMSMNKVGALLKALRLVPFDAGSRLIMVEFLEQVTPVSVDRSVKIQDTGGFPHYAVVEARIRFTSM